MSSGRQQEFDSVHKIWSGPKKPLLFDKDVSIGQVSLLILQQNTDKVIQIFDPTGEQLTCQNLSHLGIRMALIFRDNIGLQQEDVIGIMANNTTYVAPIALGAFLIGAPINPIHHSLDRNTVKHIFGLTKPKVIFCDEEAYAELVKGLEDSGLSCRIYTLKGHVQGVPSVKELLQETVPEDKFTPEDLKNGGNQCAAIVCSSGTTGLPKGVCLSHQVLLNRCLEDFPPIGYDDSLFTFSTLYWISGLWIMLRSFITGTLRVITDEPFSPEIFFKIVEKYQITQMLGPPSHATLIINSPKLPNHDLSSIRSYLCGGSAVSLALSQKLNEFLGNKRFIEGYGLSEFVGLCATNKWPNRKEGSVGRLNPNTRVKICTPEGTPLETGQIGEIIVWSPYKWIGYYGYPEMTRLTIDADGWIRTGDLGYFDEEGFLFVCGRQKDILKYRNFQISPIEIEECIQQIPGVVEVCVFGIPDEVACDLPAAAITRSVGSTLTEEDVCKKVASSFSEAKHLHGGVYFLEELPKTESGKIQRHKLPPIIAEMCKSKK